MIRLNDTSIHVISATKIGVDHQAVIHLGFQYGSGSTLSGTIHFIQTFDNDEIRDKFLAFLRNADTLDVVEYSALQEVRIVADGGPYWTITTNQKSSPVSDPPADWIGLAR